MAIPSADQIHRQVMVPMKRIQGLTGETRTA